MANIDNNSYMKRSIFLILTIVFLSKLLSSQEIRFNLINFYQDKLYEGFIGGYPITMSIYYNNDNKIFGSYYYERVKIPIKLTGKITPKNSSSSIRANDSINLKEFDNETVKALITARIDSNELVGSWKSNETNKKLPVNLKRIENQTYIYNKYPLIRTIKNQIIESEFSNYFDFSPTLDEFMEIKDNNGIYYLVLVSYNSRRETSYTQYCGNGLEEFLVFVGFDKNFEVRKSQIFQVISCMSTISTSFNDSNGNGHDFSFKESGIWDFSNLKIEISNFSSNNEETYELNTNNLALGFVHVNTKKLK